MELRQVEYLVGVADAGTFTAAAARLHVSQPSLSQGIARLEADRTQTFVARDRRLELSGLTVNVQKVFRLTRMDSVFTIHPSVPDSLRQAG